MGGPGRWQLAIAAIALAVVGTVVVIAGTLMRSPDGRGEAASRHASTNRNVSIVDAAQSVPRESGIARGGRAPRGQAPVVELTMPRFQNAFNADAGERRLLITLSPT